MNPSKPISINHEKPIWLSFGVRMSRPQFILIGKQSVGKSRLIEVGLGLGFAIGTTGRRASKETMWKTGSWCHVCSMNLMFVVFFARICMECFMFLFGIVMNLSLPEMERGSPISQTYWGWDGTARTCEERSEIRLLPSGQLR